MLTLHDVFLLPLDAERFLSRRPEQPLNCVFSYLSGEQRGVGIGEADVGAANPDRTGPSFEDCAFRHMGPAGPENLADLAQRGGEAAKVLND